MIGGIRAIVMTVMLVWVVVGSNSPVLAKELFEVTVAIQKGGRYIEPFDRRIYVTEQPTPFHIVLTNVTSSSQQLYDENRTGGYSSISIEMIDEQGRRQVIKRKKERKSSSTTSFKYIGSGKREVITMLVHPNEWENVYVMEEGTPRRFKVRVLYQNKATRLYSPYYEVTFGTDMGEIR